MSRSLPANPRLEQLKKQAKDLLRMHRLKQQEVCQTLGLLPEFRSLSPTQIIQAPLTLAQAQQAVAMEYGYKNWTLLKRLVEGPLKPTEETAEYFEDYRWSKGQPVGVGKLSGCMQNKACFKFLLVPGGVRVEQYGDDGLYLQLCHEPRDLHRGRRKRVCQGGDRTVGSVRTEDNGMVVTYERYEFIDETESSLVKCQVFNADGRLLEVHTPRQVSKSSQDIYVTDAIGKLKVVLHHRDLDKGEPVTISEEWQT